MTFETLQKARGLEENIRELNNVLKYIKNPEENWATEDFQHFCQLLPYNFWSYNVGKGLEEEKEIIFAIIGGIVKLSEMRRNKAQKEFDSL